MMLSAGVLLTLTSCDKISDLAGKAKDMTKGLVGSDEEEKEANTASAAGVESVDEEEGKTIIKEEARLVVVEFYSDT